MPLILTITNLRAGAFLEPSSTSHLTRSLSARKPQSGYSEAEISTPNFCSVNRAIAARRCSGSKTIAVVSYAASFFLTAEQYAKSPLPMRHTRDKAQAFGGAFYHDPPDFRAKLLRRAARLRRSTGSMDGHSA